MLKHIFYFSNMIYLFALKHSEVDELEKMARLSDPVKLYFMLGLRHNV